MAESGVVQEGMKRDGVGRMGVVGDEARKSDFASAVLEEGMKRERTWDAPQSFRKNASRMCSADKCE